MPAGNVTFIKNRVFGAARTPRLNIKIIVCGNLRRESTAGKQPNQLPIADPFKSEKLHSGACAKLVGTVVADLHDVTGFVSAKEDGLRLVVIVEIKERVSLLGKGSVHLVVC